MTKKKQNGISININIKSINTKLRIHFLIVCITTVFQKIKKKLIL